MKDDQTRRAVAIWLRILRLANTKNSLMGEHLRACNLSPAQFDVVAQVGSKDGLTQRELAERLVVTEGNVTQLLHKLGKQGLVTRQSEGRCNRLVLTEAGRRLYDAVVPEENAAIARRFEVLDDREQRELSRLLRKLSRSRS